MDRFLETLSVRFGVSAEILFMVGIGLGVLLLFVSVSSALTQRTPAASRIADLRSQRMSSRHDRGLLRETVKTPTGLPQRAALLHARARLARCLRADERSGAHRDI